MATTTPRRGARRARHNHTRATSPTPRTAPVRSTTTSRRPRTAQRPRLATRRLWIAGYRPERHLKATLSRPRVVRRGSPMRRGWITHNCSSRVRAAARRVPGDGRQLVGGGCDSRAEQLPRGAGEPPVRAGQRQRGDHGAGRVAYWRGHGGETRLPLAGALRPATGAHPSQDVLVEGPASRPALIAVSWYFGAGSAGGPGRSRGRRRRAGSGRPSRPSSAGSRRPAPCPAARCRARPRRRRPVRCPGERRAVCFLRWRPVARPAPRARPAAAATAAATVRRPLTQRPAAAPRRTARRRRARPAGASPDATASRCAVARDSRVRVTSSPREAGPASTAASTSAALSSTPTPLVAPASSWPGEGIRCSIA